MILTLALGIGACAAVFAVVNSVLLRPLPFAAPDQLALVPSQNQDASGKLEDYGVSVSDFLDWRERNHSFSALAAMQPGEVAITGNGDPEQVEAGFISADLFSTLGVIPHLGRFFTESEEVADSNVVILSHGFWQRRFGGQKDVLGRPVVVDGVGRQVVGVAPADFFFAASADLWVPLNLRIPAAPRIAQRNTAIVGRLRDGIRIDQASREMKGIADELAKEFAVNAGWGARALPIREPYVREVRKILVLLFAAVCFLLIVVCINVANLVLIRALQRRPELALRLALGSTRRQLLRQMLIENLLLSVFAGSVGGLLSMLLIEPMIALSPLVGSSPAGNRVLASVTFDFRVLLFVLAVSVLIGCSLSVLSLIQGSRSRLMDVLKSSGAKTTGALYARRFQKAFIVMQIAISFLLVIGALWMGQSYLRLRAVDPGFRVDRLLTARVSLPGLRYPDHRKRAELQRQVVEAAQTIPGVVSASATTRLPLNEFAMTTFFEVDGLVAPESGFVANFRRIGPSYFRTLDTLLLEGREFTPEDIETGMPVAVVSREMARQFWKGQSAIGKRIRRTAQTDRDWRTVVGVVEDVKDSSLTAPTGLTLYTPYAQQSIAAFHLVVRTAVSPDQIVGALREKVLDIDKDLPLVRIATGEELFLDSLSRPRFAAWLLGSFALLAVFIAVIGVYGVVSYSTASRVNEIGIRMAIGAPQQSILRLILSESVRLSLWGILFGVVLSLVAERAFASVWDRTGGIPVYLSTALLLGAIAFIASLIPALRATRVDPNAALRYE